MAQVSTLAQTVVEKVAEFEHVSPENLPRLEDNIDSKTYSQLIDIKGPPAKPLEFSYIWYRVTVYSDGEVTIMP